jgi:hypothetical protein
VGVAESSSEVEGGWARANTVPAELKHLARGNVNNASILGSTLGIAQQHLRSGALIRLYIMRLKPNQTKSIASITSKL